MADSVFPQSYRPVILVTADFSEDQIERLRKIGEVKQGGWGVTGEVANIVETRSMLHGVDILIVGYEPITEEVISESNLKLIASIRGGPGANVDLASAGKHGIPVTGTIGREARPVADYAFGLMLTLLRHIAVTSRLLYDGTLTNDSPAFEGDIGWGMRPEDPWNRFKGHELADKTLGLIGLGAVGREVVKRAKGFDMVVLAYDPFVQSAADARLCSLNEVLQQADILSIHARLTDQSRHLISWREFNMMKSTAYLVNTARAGIVDREALLDALQTHRIAGAALDVHHKEPLSPNDPFLRLDNVLLTPHVSGATFEVMHRHSQLVTDNVLRFLEGKALINVVNERFLQEH
jgi:D-3-phosphoglycerate dehydrogenase / 2-oxoglutarate reductase